MHIFANARSTLSRQQSANECIFVHAIRGCAFRHKVHTIILYCLYFGKFEWNAKQINGCAIKPSRRMCIAYLSETLYTVYMSAITNTRKFTICLYWSFSCLFSVIAIAVNAFSLSVYTLSSTIFCVDLLTQRLTHCVDLSINLINEVFQNRVIVQCRC